MAFMPAATFANAIIANAVVIGPTINTLAA